MKNKTKLLAVFSLLLAFCILCSCGAGKTQSPDEPTETEVEVENNEVANFKIGTNKLGDNYYMDNLGYNCYYFTATQDGYYCMSSSDELMFERDYNNWSAPWITVYKSKYTDNHSIPLKDADGLYYKVFYLNKGDKAIIGFDAYDDDFQEPNDLPEDVYIDYIGNLSSVAVQDNQSDLITGIDIYKAEDGNKTIAVDLPVDIEFSEGTTLTRNFWFVDIDNLDEGEHKAKIEFDNTDYDISLTLHEYSEYIERVLIPDSFKGKATKTELKVPESATIYYTDGSTGEIDLNAYNEITLPNGKIYSVGGNAFRKGDTDSYTVYAKLYKNDAPYPYNGAAGDSGGDELGEISIATFDF